MLALGARLAERGHNVSYQTWERWREDVTGAGMDFLPAPEYPVFPTRHQPLEPYQAVALATEPTRAQIAASRPDVVIHDILTLAPALAAELEGVTTATLVPHIYPVSPPGFPPYATGARLPRTALGRGLWGLFERPLEAGLRLGQQQLNQTRRRVGLAPQSRLHGGISERLCLIGTFPQLEYPRAWPAGVHVVGPLLWEPRAQVSAQPPAAPPGDGPLVIIAPSTSHDPEKRLLRAALEGLKGARVRVLAATDRRPSTRPIRAGCNARLVSWMPYSETMRRADLVICHGGHGTLARALASGAPVLAVPHSGDMAENAARVDWAGVGVRLPWRLLSPTTLRLAVSRALGEGRRGVDDRRARETRSRAGELAAWAAANDGPTRAAELIEQLMH
jgi:UDP:flavonoid glycosyltransferase YjiC (YdhE family)